ncbi:MAG: hypothetical protein K9K88_11400, partial [Desulfobacterales bacterium]|nr:hypothetical protein [Desulfobacterales bacterium]
AVTFGYRERASPGGGLSPPCSRLLPGARIPAFAGMTKKGKFGLVTKQSKLNLEFPQPALELSSACPGEAEGDLWGAARRAKTQDGPSVSDIRHPTSDLYISCPMRHARSSS